jgi:metal-dependent amidase/aminoacylase/carboxypeptidase family protein
MKPVEIATLTAWRRSLHRHPEVSGAEAETAARVVEALRPLEPAQIVTGPDRDRPRS